MEGHIHIKGKPTGRQTSTAFKSFKRVAVSAATGAALFAGLFVLRYTALSQQGGYEAIDVDARSRDIVNHLNSVIQYYRASTQTIQKVGEPNDVVYRDQAVEESTQIAAFAFQSANAEAALLRRYQLQHGTQTDGSGSEEQQRMQAAEANAEKQIEDLKARQEVLGKQLATARPRDIAGLEAEKEQIQEALDLADAMKDALQKIAGMSGGGAGTGLAGDIDRLQHSVPELQSKNRTPAPQLTMLDSARSAGVTSQGSVLFELLETRHSLDALTEESGELQKQAQALRAPMSKILRNLILQGQQLSQQTAPPATQPAAATPKVPATSNPAASAGSAQAPNPEDLKTITADFKALAAATVPLSEEIIVLEQSRANLAAWKSSVTEEYNSILHSLLLRVLVIAVALCLIIGGGELWTRATNKYVRDLRRRRQFLIVRRFVVGFLSLIVIVFGFVTQFNSLATFAGFITAGIAVGLQTVLLSVAAYFFIIGRYGIKVGDRITIAAVTGDVVDVGLVRFYLMELAGTGTSLNPTGRIAVFSNAVLFQAGTPLYKQIPGADYAWHELIVKLTDAADYKMVCEAVMKEVHTVYEDYREAIERQHKGAESAIQTSIDPPVIESRLQFTGGSFQLWARFPVEFDHASEADEKIIRALLDLISRVPEIKAAVAATPVIQSSVRG
ncbi:MAG: mechanosensitive ion channel protein MscS [Terracidiphilus sp.]